MFTGANAQLGQGAHGESCEIRRPKTRILEALLPFILSLLLICSTQATWAQGDSQPPTVIGQSPSPGVNGQAVNSNVTATFSEAIQPASLAFVLRDSANTIVPANLSYDASTHTVTLHPSADLLASRTYTATVSGAMDLAGNTMSYARRLVLFYWPAWLSGIRDF